MPRTRLESRLKSPRPVARRHGTAAAPIKLQNRGAMLKSLAQAARADAFGGATDAKLALHTRTAEALGAKGAAALEAFLKNKPPALPPPAQATVGTGPAPVQPGAGATVGTGPALTAPVHLLGNGHVRTFDGNHDVSATGNKNVLTITGHCPELTLTGNENRVVITGTVDRLVLSGNHNHVSWPADRPAPTIVEAGLGNTLGEG